jgi:prevent-host-death family protein
MAELIVGVRELKANLSRYLREVKAGRSVTITERGKTVGRLVPGGQSVEERMQAMIDAGLAEWNGQHLPPVTKAVRNRGKKLASEILIEDRR